MKEIFHKTAFTTHRPLDLEVNENHATKYRNKSLRCLGPHIQNSLPNRLHQVQGIYEQLVWHEV